MESETELRFKKKFTSAFGWIAQNMPKEIISGVQMDRIGGEILEFIKENYTEKDEIEKLSKYIMDKHPKEMKGEGAVDTAIAIMSKIK